MTVVAEMSSASATSSISRLQEIEKIWAAYLGESLDDRLSADYDPQVFFNEKEAREECSRSRKFIQESVVTLLKRDSESQNCGAGGVVIGPKTVQGFGLAKPLKIGSGGWI